ncbi:UNVERIFIED_CONTAM: hypothetical protein Slati_1721100 [Sesamum latifolium]|uniref:Retrotransposon Copia-like N-terminal domain-containing protein n=1 Tax=Sesamum latifolium TaxID=2727402 RepID=A0AAW2WVM9_9LAMI
MYLDQSGFDFSRPFIHSNGVRKLPLPKCGLTSRGTLGLRKSCTIVVNKEITLVVFLSHKSWRATIEGMEITLMDPKPLRKWFPKTPLESDMFKNPLTMILKTNKFNGTNYNDWLRNLRIVLDFENQGYILNEPPQSALPEDSSPEQRLANGMKITGSDIQKQYDRLNDVSSIMLRMSDVYAVSDRRIRYAAIKSILWDQAY